MRAGVGGDVIADKLSDIPSKRIDAMLDSLSIEEESTGPRRYIGKLTVRFLPDKMRKMMAELGVGYSEKLAGKTVVVPVWRTPEGVGGMGRQPLAYCMAVATGREFFPFP